MEYEQSPQVPNDGPWIRAEHCGYVKCDPKTGIVLEVLCPSILCQTVAPVVDGRIAAHERQLRNVAPGPCVWIGVRVVGSKPVTPGDAAPSEQQAGNRAR